MTRLRSIALLALTQALLLPQDLAGQDSLPGKPRKSGQSNRGRGKLEFELPGRPEQKPETAPTTPEELVRALLPDLADYPGGASARAMDELVLAGKAVKPPLRLVLAGIQFPPRIAAALVLSRLGDLEALDGMEDLLEDPRSRRYAGQILTAISAVDGDRAEQLAGRHADAGTAALRAAAFRFLRRRARPELLPILQPLLGHSKAGVRKNAFDLMRTIEGVELSGEALALLGDDDSQLASAATSYLAARSDARMVGELTRLSSEDPPSRRALWALLTLAEVEERTGQTLLPDDQTAVLTTRMRSVDPLMKLSAAIALAQLGARSQAVASEALLAEQVLPTIMETFLRNEYFKDYMPLFRMSAVRVRRITGLDLGEDLTQWRAAWLGEGGAPLIRRDLDPDRLAELANELVIRYRRRGHLLDGLDTEILLAGSSLLIGERRSVDLDGALFLSAGEMRELVTALVDCSVFNRGRFPGSDEEAWKKGSRLTVLWQNRERSVAAGAQTDESFELADRLLRETADRAFWQTLYFGDPAEFAGWFYSQGPNFAAGIDPVERQRLLLRSVQIGLPLLTPPQRVQAIEVLCRQLTLIDLLGVEDLRLLLSGLESERVPEGCATLLASMVLRKGDPVLFSPFAEFLLSRFGEASGPLLRRLIRGLALFEQALHDGRPLVRIAALEESAEGGGLQPERLLDALFDADARVRRTAIITMGRVAEGDLRTRLFEIATADASALRRVGLEALGWEGSAEALQVLTDAIGGGEPADVLAAYRGLVRIGGEATTSLLEESVVRFGVRAQTGLSALDTLVDIGSRSARVVLKRFLTADDLELREEAAYRLARLGVMESVPVLLAVLDQPERAARARDALALLFCCDGGEQGEEYVQRHRDTPDLTRDEWFRRALGLMPATPAEADLVAGIPLTILVETLRSPHWYLRHHAVAHLEQEFGLSFGASYRFATDEDVAHLAERWEGYFAVPYGLR